MAASVSQAGRTICVNSHFLAMFGYDRPEEIVGRPILEWLTPGDCKEAMSATAVRNVLD